MSAESALFNPSKLGTHQLQHKIVLAPLTRMRGGQYDPDASLMAEYYSQRSSKGGLIITEGTLISPQARAQSEVPGIWNEQQAQYWRIITDRIREKEAISCCQIWHRGRCAGKREWEFQGVKYRPIGPSAIPEKEGRPVPTEMSIADIEQVIEEYANAVKMAIDQAGFDLVEIHDANGYLLDQFLQSMSNHRNDEYGGTLEKRFTLSLRVLDAVTRAVGQEKVGVRFSPYSEFQGMRETDPLKTFVPLVERVLTQFPSLAFIHLVESRINGASDRENYTEQESLDPIRQIVAKHNRRSGCNVQLVIAGGFTIDSATEHAKRYPDELLAFGRYFIANPDLPDRIRNGWPLNPYDRSTFYTKGGKGYIDYPSYQQRSSNL